MLEGVLTQLEYHGMNQVGIALVWLILLLIRWLIGLHSYSGQRTPPMFGDYEAQRHWMEITLNLPISEWYFNSTQNDLLYWGLDYPPLTAYVSYAFGIGAYIIEPELVELTTSRGYESERSKVWMRTSVIICDVILFMPAVFWLTRLILQGKSWSKQTVFGVVVLMQPGLLLIDHGHFQYNNVCLGFTTLAVALLWKDHEILGSIAFCLALNFKQMALYYAPAVGSYLLSKCLYRNYLLLHLVKLCVAVVGTFAMLWYPLCIYRRADETCLTSVSQVVHRIFPFARGLFEDKVANVWCVADLLLKIRRRIIPSQQMQLCTIATALGFLPAIINLLYRKPTKTRFLLALANSSLSFFLFSFQVHEKSILLPLLPISLLYHMNSLLSSWFGFISTFSMYFLLKKDGLMLPYLVLQALFFCVALLPQLENSHRVTQAYVILSIVGTVVIHVVEAIVEPPSRYPHIFDYVFATYSCGHFLLALGFCTYWQWTIVEKEVETSSNSKAKTE